MTGPSMDGMGHTQARYGVMRTGLASLAPVTLTVSQGAWTPSREVVEAVLRAAGATE